MESQCIGWFILVLTYLVLFAFHNVRENKKLLFSLIFVISLHHAIAILNAYGTTIESASVDAITFYRSALHIINDHIPLRLASGAYFYPNLLAFFYKIFGPSVFLGEELSVLAFTLSCFVFIRLCQLLNYKKNVALLILLYGSLPSGILFTSITMRESWQVLFFMGMMYFLLKNLFFGSLISWAGMIIFAFIFCLFHEGFVIFVPLLLCVFIAFHIGQLNSKLPIDFKQRCLSLSLTIFILIATVILLQINRDKLPELASFYALIKGNAYHFLMNYHNRILGFPQRTDYSSIITHPSPMTLLFSLLSNYIHFMFSPFPWQISRPADILALLESIIRFILIVIPLITLFAVKENKKTLIFLFCTYFMLSILWSLGVSNYGTALRHQMISFWLLLLLLGAWLNHKSNTLSQSIRQI